MPLVRGVFSPCPSPRPLTARPSPLPPPPLPLQARCAQAFAAVQRFEEGYHIASSSLPEPYLAAREEWFSTAATFAG